MMLNDYTSTYQGICAHISSILVVLLVALICSTGDKNAREASVRVVGGIALVGRAKAPALI